MEYRQRNKLQRQDFATQLKNQLINDEFLKKVDFISQLKKKICAYQKLNDIIPTKSITINNEGLVGYMNQQISKTNKTISKRKQNQCTQFITKDYMKEYVICQLNKVAKSDERDIIQRENNQLLYDQINTRELKIIYQESIQNLFTLIIHDRTGIIDDVHISFDSSRKGTEQYEPNQSYNSQFRNLANQQQSIENTPVQRQRAETDDSLNYMGSISLTPINQNGSLLQQYQKQPSLEKIISDSKINNGQYTTPVKNTSKLPHFNIQTEDSKDQESLMISSVRSPQIKANDDVKMEFGGDTSDARTSFENAKNNSDYNSSTKNSNSFFEISNDHHLTSQNNNMAKRDSSDALQKLVPMQPVSLLTRNASTPTGIREVDQPHFKLLVEENQRLLIKNQNI